MTDTTTRAPAPAGAPPVIEAAESERRTNPVELFWDLVFVFAVTQVTTLLSRHLSWAGLGRAMLILALIWWAWSAFVWAANAEENDSAALRLTLLTASGFIFIAGLALPQAFGAEGMLFAITYALVRFLHLALYAEASRRGRASWSAIAGFAITVVIGMALLIVGAALHEGLRIGLWLAAVAIDYAGPAWLTRQRLRGLQRVAVAHFAERYGLFVIICLGESIVAIGVGASHVRVSAELVSVVALGLMATGAMWWAYFDSAPVAESHLRAHSDPVLAAADAYSYLHLVIVAGVIIFAAGVRLLIGALGQAAPGSVRLALCGGVAMYLLGDVAFAWRLIGRIGYPKVFIAAALLILSALSGGISAWALVAVIVALLALLGGVERLRVPGRAGIPPRI